MIASASTVVPRAMADSPLIREIARELGQIKSGVEHELLAQAWRLLDDAFRALERDD